MIKAKLFKKLENGCVKCLLCSHYCKIESEKFGICKVRKNISGELYSLNSDKIISMSSDPIEKKPLYHFLPASISYSIAAMGCNFSCDFCQNNSISIINNTNKIYGKKFLPENIIKNALNYNAKSIAYTYTEPTIYYELVKETTKSAKAEGLKNIMITNGFLSNEAIDNLVYDIDAVNIDIKAFSDNFYRQYCKGRLEPVLNTIKRMKESNIHIEITTLLINGKNDNIDEIKSLIEFILETDSEIPWHISRFYPSYKFNEYEATDIESIYEIVDLAKSMGLEYVYSGNIQNNKYANTLCPYCHTILIKRLGFSTEIINLKNGKCQICNKIIKGVWSNQN